MSPYSPDSPANASPPLAELARLQLASEKLVHHLSIRLCGYPAAISHGLLDTIQRINTEARQAILAAGGHDVAAAAKPPASSPPVNDTADAPGTWTSIRRETRRLQIACEQLAQGFAALGCAKVAQALDQWSRAWIAFELALNATASVAVPKPL